MSVLEVGFWRWPAARILLEASRARVFPKSGPAYLPAPVDSGTGMVARLRKSRAKQVS